MPNPQSTLHKQIYLIILVVLITQNKDCDIAIQRAVEALYQGK